MKYKIFQRIIKNILQHLEMSYEEMFDKSNKPDSVRARQLLYYLCNKRGMGATEIQNYMEKEGYVVASHSTILYGIDLIKKLLSEDTDFNLITLRLQEIEDFA
jgi:chromosomal replication initiation ATPase DnaA|tara:strand:- start:507 stop:815 length:309 start_codon:yes stop_codon:yes gene_type:complete